ncbi:hypothetical protein ACIRPX_16065 [Streptomyces sp. NPDC101225]|uniref:hypothetical protein n=1 Tax=Streptomyces sp. NPDC101225 TaxID=3366135 RepID=UPI0037FBB0E0
MQGIKVLIPALVSAKVFGPLNLSIGVKVLIFVICLLFSALSAGSVHKPGSRKRDAVLFAGGAFIGVMTLCLAVMGALGVLSGGPV